MKSLKILALAAVLAGCGADQPEAPPAPPAEGGDTPAPVVEEAAMKIPPATGMRLPAEIKPLVGGSRGWPFGAPAADLDALGYELEEFQISGTAQSYRAVPGTVPGRDGVWQAEAASEAPYTTRLYVVRPKNPEDSNGVLVLNWQNVTYNLDVGFPSGDEIFRGYTWVGVTAQKIGVDGMPGQTPALSTWDPQRYGALSHPGDAYSYDIFAQAGRLLLDPKRNQRLLGGLKPVTLIATGGSQSAMRLASYINIAQPHDQLFDGFLLTVHWGLAPPLAEVSLREQFAPAGDGTYAATASINDRGDVPILELNTETEVLHNYPVRRANSDTYRYWEIAGAGHGDRGQQEDFAAVMRRDLGAPPGASATANTVRWGYVKDAALRQMVRWVREGGAPPVFPPIQVTESEPGKLTVVRDELGNALGGIRLPEIAAATGVHLGSDPTVDPLLALYGKSTPFSEEEMLRVHGSREGFLASWDKAVADLLAAELMLASEAETARARGRQAWPQ
jgi:hypothetical protein